ncbi:hypothetical protein V2H45_15720 [Tumidithrix elongata RA019]|uniref:Uncharacterized protein n=1 Tax=Tumidithrix elongata BACA0141 TaxID=2716417 RepID=A0AAW9Q1X0_9CYAN|nr:hypothetical protein [Tumidithrix elongata RA019]
MIDILPTFISAIDVSSFDLSLFDFNLLDFNIFDVDWTTLAQTGDKQFPQDVLGDMGKGWNGFVKSGQIWALLIGLIAGYLFRSITAG